LTGCRGQDYSAGRFERNCRIGYHKQRVTQGVAPQNSLYTNMDKDMGKAHQQFLNITKGERMDSITYTENSRLLNKNTQRMI